MPSHDLIGKSAIVTGASSGIGRETVRELARAGCDVSLVARSEEKLRELAEEVASYDVNTYVAPANIRDEAAVKTAVEETIEAFDGLDVAVANAGAGAPGTGIHEMETEEYRTLIETNIDGTFFTARSTIPPLLESEGHLVFMSSIAGQYPRPATPLYAATKWWIRGFGLSVEARYGPEGLGVTIINPAEVRTDIEVLGTPLTDRFEEGEVVEPEEVAEAVAFAARTENATMSEIDVYWRGKLGQF